MEYRWNPATTPAELVERGEATMSRSYKPAPVVVTHGEGMHLWDADGNKYLDFLGGIAVSSLGHAHPRLVEAISTQAARVLHVANGVWTEPQIVLQTTLTAAMGLDRAYLCNSGAEANEAAIKLARRYQRVVAGRPSFEVITFFGSFHGRTYGAISATAQPKYHAGFEPMVPGFVYAEFNNLASVERVIGAHTAAIMVEVVQGEGGVRPADQEFITGLRNLCDAHGLLLIVDEVQTGVGRLGEMSGCQRYGITPDIMTLAKGLGGGVPVGATLFSEAVSHGFERGSHASTFGGNPLACAAAATVLDVVNTPEFLANVTLCGAQLRGGLQKLVDAGRALEVRGAGLLNGLVMDADAAQVGALVNRCRLHGLFLNSAGGTVIRMVPPLVCAPEDVTDALERFDRAENEWRAGGMV
jgi:predicted acetylornithine/succinylornithine family transaminase